MDVRRFLEAVLAWGSGGYVTVHKLVHYIDAITGEEKHAMPGRSCQTVEAALIQVEKLKAGPPLDIFFCLSTQRVGGGSRKQEHAVAFRALFLDIDVGPPDPEFPNKLKYLTVEDALRAIEQFCIAIGIPTPSAIVLSGKGIHVYWFSDRDLLLDEWQPYADALKAAAHNSELRFDPAVPADAVRVLRVPDTFNYKYPEEGPLPVQLMPGYAGATYNFTATFTKLIGAFAKKRRTTKQRTTVTHLHLVPKMQMAPAFAHLKLDAPSPAEGMQVKEAPPVPFALAKEACPWLRDMHETGGAGLSEPQWHIAVQMATFMEEGRDIAHELSNKYDGYTLTETDNKFDASVAAKAADKRIGWPYCDTVKDRSGDSHCSKCPHAIKGKSPLYFGHIAAQAIRDNKELQELGGSQPAYLRLPEGYATNEQGQLCAFIPSISKSSKTKAGKLLWLISPRILSAPKLELQDNNLGISFIIEASRIEEREVFFTFADTAKEGTMYKALLNNGIIYNKETEAKPLLEKFPSSWLDRLRLEDVPTIRDNGEMGWRHVDGKITGFVYGNHFYKPDGSIVKLAKHANLDDVDFYSWYRPTGSRDVWVQAAKLLTDRKRPELDILIAAAFAAPLTVFAGTLYGPILIEYGEPGTSKSTGQQVASAVWGHPKQTRESLTSTPKSILGRLGRTRNLAAYWDDVQDERHMQALYDALFVATEGTEGGRLNVDASYKERKQWQTILVACANASFVEYLTRKQKSTTAGMRRVFEIEYNRDPNEPGMIDHLDASRTFAALEHNYGIIGAEYSALLATQHEAISEAIATVIKRFSGKVGAITSESYWVGLCGVLLVGAIFARQLGAEIDVKAMEIFLINAFFNNRRIRLSEGTEGGTYDHTERALVAFLNEYIGAGHSIVTNVLFKSRHTNVIEEQHRNAGKPAYIQISRNDSIILISRRALREWLHKNEIHTRQLFDGLKKWFKAKETKMTIGAGTPTAQGQEHCFAIHVTNRRSPLYGIVTAHGGPTPTSVT